MRITTTLLRSKWKGPHFAAFPLRESRQSGSPIVTRARASTILPAHVGITFLIHNGQTYTPVTVKQEMVGHRLGEFAPSRKPMHFRKTGNA